MKPLDYLKALGVALVALVVTLAASFPMVAFYAFFIEPGQPQEFYNEAALWIAPWSSYTLGTLMFFVLNFGCAKRRSDRPAMLFATTTIVFYLLVDLGMLPLMGDPLISAFTLPLFLSLAVKLIAAFTGAWLGSRAAVVAGKAST